MARGRSTNGTLDFFNLSALELPNPTEPFQQLRVSGDFAGALAVSESQGFAVGTNADMVELFDRSALQPHGPMVPFQELHASGRVTILAVLENHGLLLVPGITHMAPMTRLISSIAQPSDRHRLGFFAKSGARIWHNWHNCSHSCVLQYFGLGAAWRHKALP